MPVIQSHTRIRAPLLGPLGRIADALVLTRYMRRFLAERNRIRKQVAEQ